MHFFSIILKVYVLMITSGYQDRTLLFDGTSLSGWQVIDYQGHGNITVIDSTIIINRGETISGIIWTGEIPHVNYEVQLLAKRVEGSDFFCGITFPVKDSFISLILGGWGGSVTGLSCIEGFDAANNETYSLMNFEQNKWYEISLKVTSERIIATVDNEKIVDFRYGNSYLSTRWEADSSIPFGFMTYKTTGALKEICLIKYP